MGLFIGSLLLIVFVVVVFYFDVVLKTYDFLFLTHLILLTLNSGST